MITILMMWPSNFNSGHPVLVHEASLHVANVKNIPDWGIQSDTKRKTGMRKANEPWKWINHSKTLDRMECITEGVSLGDLNLQ